MENQNYCTVCKIDSEGNYCSHCGQQIQRQKTTFFSMIADIVLKAVDVEKSVFASIFILLKNPKLIIVNFWDGYRNYYPSPGKFLLYAIAVAALHIAYVDKHVMGILINIDYINPQIAFWIIILPFLTLAPYLTFVKKKISFTKHLIANLYIAACFFILVTVMCDIIKLTYGISNFSNVTFAFIFLVIFWNARVFTQRKGLLYVFLNSIITLLMFCGILLIFFAIIYLINSNSIQGV